MQPKPAITNLNRPKFNANTARDFSYFGHQIKNHPALAGPDLSSMNVFTFVIIIVVLFILAGMFRDHPKNKLKQKKTESENKDTIKDLETQINALRKRVENLEIIATSDSESFADRRNSIILDDADADDEQTESRHEKLVNELARKRRQRN
jgi:hypothetical protein